MADAVRKYDARDIATRPDLCVPFEAPPPLPPWLEDAEVDCE